MDTTTPDPQPGPAPSPTPGPTPADGPAPTGESAPAGGPGGPAPHRSGADGFFDSLYRVGVQRTDDRWVGGVAGGVARRLGLDPLLVRGVWFVLCLVAGAGLVLYALAWAFLPDARNQRILVRDAAHGNFDVALLGAIALFIVGVNWRIGWWGWWNAPGWIAGLFWVCLLAGAGVLIGALVTNRPPSDAGATSAYPNTAYPNTANPTSAYPNAAYPGTTVPLGTPGAPPWTPPEDAPAPPRTDKVRTPVAPTPRTPGAGATTVGIVLGSCLIAGAIVFGVTRSDTFSAAPWLAWGGICLVLLGLGIVVAGLRGRRAGGLTALAVIGALVVVPSAAFRDTVSGGGDLHGVAPDQTVRVTDVATAEDGFSYAVGDLSLDLRDLPLPATDPVEVPVRVGAGTTRILVPANTEIEADVRLLGGDIHWDVAGATTTRSGVRADSEQFRTPGVEAGAPPQLVLDVVSAAGDVTIEEQP